MPTHRIPREATLTEAVLARDISCRLTNHIEGTEHAHLVPEGEQSWFDRNSMARFCQISRAGIDAINTPRNAIALRSDVHTLFDNKRFAIAPKQSSQGALSWSVHVLIPGQHPQMIQLYHNVTMQPFAGIAVENILARFAWAIFESIQIFISQGTSRTLSVYDGSGRKTVELKGKQMQAHLRQHYARSRSSSSQKKSSSPAKRSIEEVTEDEADEVPRGRQKRRRFKSCSAEPRESTPWLTNDDSASHETSQEVPWLTDNSDSLSVDGANTLVTGSKSELVESIVHENV